MWPGAPLEDEACRATTLIAFPNVGYSHSLLPDDCAHHVFGASPSAWMISSVGPNWANFIELLTLLLPVRFAPVIAEKMTPIP